MAQINTYSPDNHGRVCVQYQRDLFVNVGVQRAEVPTVIVEGVENVAVTSSVPAKFADDGGLWTELDRQGINNLIRHLREARDKAFGRDE